MAATVSQYPTEWHRDQAALDWLDELLDQQYQRGLKTAENLLDSTMALQQSAGEKHGDNLMVFLRFPLWILTVSFRISLTVAHAD